MSLGNTAYKDSLYYEADSLYDIASRAQETAGLTFNQGNSRYQQQAFDEAMAFWNDVAAQDDIARDAHYNIGNALLQQGELPAAINSYKKALRIDPSFLDAQHNLSLALMAQQQQEQEQRKKRAVREASLMSAFRELCWRYPDAARVAAR